MSLLRNFTPGGSEPDDEQPIADDQPDETAPPVGRHAAGTARYAFASPETDTEESAAPAPAGVVASEVVTEPDPAAADWAPAPAPVAEAPAPEEAPVPSFTPAAEASTYEAPAPDLATAPDVATAPVPVPSPRAADEVTPAAPTAAMLAPDHIAPLLSDAAELRTRWQRVQGDFVDDPKAAVSNAAALVDQTAEAMMEAVRLRQRQLRAAWERGAADGQSPAMPDTEALRLMMQRYRALFNEICRPS